MKPLAVAGLGCWAPGFASLDARLLEDPDAAQVEPPCTLLPARMARRASLLTRMTIEAISQAAEAAKVDVRQVPTVFATARGEMQTLVDLLGMLIDDGQLSPTRFHNSVYNAAAGQFSVAVGNQAFSTTLVGGDETVPLALLEAFCLFHELQPPAVIVAFADEAVSLPLLSSAGTEALACAICLVAEPASGAALPWLTAPVRDGAPKRLAGLGRAHLNNPVSCALPLLRALKTRTAGALSFGTPDGWSVEVLGSGGGR